MCRHLAWLGPSRTLAELIIEPEFGLLRQSYAPRRQRYGTINADGFGAAWYVTGRTEPVRYRRAQPMWSDASFGSLAPTIASGCVLAAVRSATIGTAADESCAAPFTDGAYAFSHNGRIQHWAAARRAWATEFADVPEAWCAVDSGVAFGLAAAAWRRGARLGEGLTETVSRLLPFAERLTFLATDGHRLAATVVGEPMYLVQRGGGVLVASEPDTADDQAGDNQRRRRDLSPGTGLPGDGGTPDDAARAGWTQIPDRHLITAEWIGVEPNVRIIPLALGAE